MKLRKILSLVLAAAMLCTVCFIGGISAEASAVVKEDGNYILNGSFELAETKDDGEVYGYESWCVNHGGTGVVVDYWNTFNWLNGNSAVNPNIKITHTTDAHTGDYALYYDIPYGNTHYTYPTALAVDELPAGNYRLTAWVKGTNSASLINVTDANGNVKSVNIVASEDWTQISIDNINGIGKATVNGKEVIGIVIQPKKGDAASYFIIDDIRLEAVEAEVEYLIGGGLETADSKWNSAAGKSGDTGYSNYIVGNGQHNLLADGWLGTNWLAAAPARIFTDHTTDAYSGNYALKVNIPTGSNTMTLYPKPESVNLSAITEGYYTLSAWVKSTNTATDTKLEVISTYPDSETALTYSKQIPAGEEWHKVSVYDIYLTDGAANLATYGNGYHIKAMFAKDTSTTENTYVIIDDITLEKQGQFYNGGMEIDGRGNTTVPNGQAIGNYVLQGYTIQEWSGGKNTYEVVTGEENVHSGEQALKINYNSSSAYLYSRYDGVDLAAGTYKMSSWVKGNASKARFKAFQATTEAPSTEIGWLKNTYILEGLSEEEWTYYEWTFTINNGYTICRTLEHNQTSVYFNKLGFGIDGAVAGEYAIFDDIKLEKLADAATVAASIIGVDAPAKGATKLTLPEVDSNITLSIVESSDESVVALDGTIIPPAGRTLVDITLKVSDGKNEVTLDPIGVVIPGTEQLEIDAVKYAINLLPNGNASNPQLPIHYADALAAREMYNALSDEAKLFVVNAVTLGEREGSLNQYSAVIDAASTKNDKLRIKAAYPTKAADGYTVKEYGMLFIPTALAEDENITLDTANVAKSVMTQLPGEADACFYSILNGSEAHPDVEILMRSYVTYEYGDGEIVTLYGRDVVKSSASALAQ